MQTPPLPNSESSEEGLCQPSAGDPIPSRLPEDARKVRALAYNKLSPRKEGTEPSRLPRSGRKHCHLLRAAGSGGWGRGRVTPTVTSKTPPDRDEKERVSQDIPPSLSLHPYWFLRVPSVPGRLQSRNPYRSVSPRPPILPTSCLPSCRLKWVGGVIIPLLGR